MTATTTKQRADAVRPLVEAEYDRLREEEGLPGDQALKIMGLHLAAVSDKLRIPLAGPSYGSVRHLISGHDGHVCTCKHEADGTIGECSRVPKLYVLEAFEAAAADYPIAEPSKLASQRRAPRSRKDPLAAMIAEGIVTRPRR
jgi:hypothetical protein